MEGRHVSTTINCSYRIDEVEIDAAGNRVRRMGSECGLRHQAFHVLLYLVEHTDRLVTKEELIAEIWPDAVVTENALTQCITEIRKALGDNPRNPTYIRTIPKVGYQFVASVQVIADKPLADSGRTASPSLIASLSVPAALPHAVTSEARAAVGLPSAAKPQFSRRTKSHLAWGAVLLALVAAIAVEYRIMHRAYFAVAPLTNGRSLAVMYFDNESDRKDLDWLRQGLTDMMITDMSQSGDVEVLSRQQLAVLVQNEAKQSGRVSPDEAMQIAQAVHAAEYLTGSYWAVNGQFRIDIQLHDSRSGRIVFADHRVFQNPGDILNQIDLLAARLSSVIDSNPAPAPNIAEATTNNLEAYQYYSLGVEKAQEFENAQALNLLKQAVQLDPSFAMAWARIGYTYAIADFAPEKGMPYLETAVQLSSHLSERDRLYVNAWYEIAKGDYTAAVETLRRIVQLYPQETEASWRLALLLRAQEHPKEALDIVERALKSNPDDKNLFNTKGFVLLSMYRYPEAIAAYRRYVELAPGEPNAHDSLGMAYEQSGSYESALSEYKKALMLDPKFEPSIIHIGDVYYQVQQYGKAISYYRNYVREARTNDSRALGYGDLATVYIAMNRIPEAVQAATHELENSPQAVWSSVVIALRKSDYVTAKRLEQILFRDIPSQERGAPGDQRTRFYYEGYIELHGGDSKKALEDFKLALEHLPPSSGMDSYEDCLANAELQLGYYKKAADEYKRILGLNPNYPMARSHLALAMAHLRGRAR